MATASQDATLAAKVYSVVRRRIIRGALRPGQPLSRRRLATEMGMSVLPVNEALQRLEVEGLLQSRPRAGTRVRVPSPEDVVGHYVVREALEVEAARRAAMHTTNAQVVRLKIAADELDNADPGSEDGEYAVLHQRFHRRIAELSRCAALIDAIERTHARAMLWVSQPTPGAHLHMQLVDAIATHDPGAAGEAMRRHLAHGLGRSLEALRPYFPLNGGTAFKRGRRRRSSSDKREALPIGA